MANRLQLRRGNSADRTSITPAVGEPLWDTDTNRLYMGDGSTAGGVLITGTDTNTTYAFSDSDGGFRVNPSDTDSFFVSTGTSSGGGGSDSDTTYTFANGTNGSFTVTPSGGSAQTVTTGSATIDTNSIIAGTNITVTDTDDGVIINSTASGGGGGGHLTGIFDGEDTEFLTSGTWTKPSGVTEFAVLLVPGGVRDGSTPNSGAIRHAQTATSLILVEDQGSADTDYAITVGAAANINSGFVLTGNTSSITLTSGTVAASTRALTYDAQLGTTRYCVIPNATSEFLYIVINDFYVDAFNTSVTPYVATDGSIRGRCVAPSSHSEGATAGAVRIFWPSSS